MRKWCDMRIIGTLIAFVVFGSACLADEVSTVDGRVLEGKILEEGDPLELKMLDGMVVLIPADRVEKTTQKRSLLDDFEEKRSQVAAGDVDGLVKLAAWCGENGLVGGRIELLGLRSG